LQCEGPQERRGILTDGGRRNSTVKEASGDGGEAREIEGLERCSFVRMHRR